MVVVAGHGNLFRHAQSPRPQDTVHTYRHFIVAAADDARRLRQGRQAQNCRQQRFAVVTMVGVSRLQQIRIKRNARTFQRTTVTLNAQPCGFYARRQGNVGNARMAVPDNLPHQIVLPLLVSGSTDGVPDASKQLTNTIGQAFVISGRATS